MFAGERHRLTDRQGLSGFAALEGRFFAPIIKEGEVIHLAGKTKPIMEVRAFATGDRASPVADGSGALC